MTNLPLIDNSSFMASDMSPYVVHFTKDASTLSAFDVCKLILDEQIVKAKNSFGTGKEYAYCPKSVCFSEVPLKELSRFRKNRGKFGFGFHKEFIVERGGGPVLYAYKETPQSKAFKEMVDAAQSNFNDLVWKLAPFIDRPGWYQKYQRDLKYFFEWEREWRHVGDLNFREGDLSFLVLPEDKHDELRLYLSEESRRIDLPRYLSQPFICLEWEKTKIQDTLRDAKVKNWYSSV